MKKSILSLLALVLLTGCATGLQVDRTYSAKGQSSRVKFVVLHYTVIDTPKSLRALTQEVVSSHYLVTDEASPKVYGLVDETRQSNHAGVSNWKNYTLLNGSSIGIEIVNPGFTESPAGRVWYPFPQAQVDKVIELVKDIVARHQVPPENILGHSDIAPMRKQDPGPLFPWHQLAKQGLVTWPDAARVNAARAVYGVQLPDTAWFQKRLSVIGYAVPQTGQFDAGTRAAMVAFQMKYRPAIFDGNPDTETAALLEALAPTPVPPPAPIPPPPPPVPARPPEVLVPPVVNPAPAVTPPPVITPAPIVTPPPVITPAPIITPAPVVPPAPVNTPPQG